MQQKEKSANSHFFLSRSFFRRAPVPFWLRAHEREKMAPTSDLKKPVVGKLLYKISALIYFRCW
jgi:hypothetical protein